MLKKRKREKKMSALGENFYLLSTNLIDSM
jgi:hypothetical protein